MDLTIRPAVIDDAPALASFAGALFSERLPGILDRPAPTLEGEIEFMRPYLDHDNSVMLVAEHRGSIVGLLDFRGGDLPELAHCGIFGVAVSHAHRGRGVGTKLIEALLAWAPLHAVRRVELHAWQTNPRALALYERLGFEREGVLRHAVIRDGHVVDVLILAKLLEA